MGEEGTIDVGFSESGMVAVDAIVLGLAVAVLGASMLCVAVVRRVVVTVPRSEVVVLSSTVVVTAGSIAIENSLSSASTGAVATAGTTPRPRWSDALNRSSQVPSPSSSRNVPLAVPDRYG